MAKPGNRRRIAALFESVVTRAAHEDTSLTDEIIAASPSLALLLPVPGAPRELVKMKKFRFQLLHQWLTNRRGPCRVADVAGGKGLLAYLLQESGWTATVIDPVSQDLPPKYKDLVRDRQIRIAETKRVPRRDVPFAPEMARDFDLLVAMHAHGCNIQLLEAAAHYGRDVLLLPCCIIGEPLVPPPGMHWLEYVAEKAISLRFTVEPFRLNFKGQNIGLYARPRIE